MNTFLDLVKKRQTTHSYDSTRPVEREKIERIMEAARLAPSAHNSQPWHFIVVDDEMLKNKLADTTSTIMLDKFHFTKKAPVHILVIQERGKIFSMIKGFITHQYFPHIDLGLATSHLVLAATDEGLSTSIITWFDESKVKKLFGIKGRKKPMLIVTLGYTTEEIRPKHRKPIDQIVSYNKY